MKDQMQTDWKKLENENGFPFYINEITKEKQWDHPDFIEIKSRIDDCNYVKYSKYRVALKFRILQKALFVYQIPLNTIIGVFEKHRLGINEGSLCLESYDLEAVLSDIFFAADKQNQLNLNVDFAVELMQNFLYNIYDKERQNKIQVSSTKLVLALLSNCDLSQLYSFIFKLCADHNNCVTRLRLQALLNKLVAIFIFLHEDVNFGHHLLNSTIENCFNNSPGLVGVTENNFISWLEEAPQLLSWIPILHKLKSSELVVHPGKCSSCKSSPIMGLMYRCTKCSKYTQCQHCFFSGRTTNAHKLSHTMREYCTEGSPREFNFNFIKKIRGLMPCSMKFNETVDMVESQHLSEKDSFSKSLSEDFYCNLEPKTSPRMQLQLVIKQLEMQNRELHNILLLGNHNEKQIRQYLEKHKMQVSMQIHKLNILKDYLDVGPQKNLQSTPMAGMIKYQPRSIDMLSPILQGDSENEPIMDDSLSYSINDISTWIRDQPTNSKNNAGTIPNSPVRELHNDLDDALAKLQQILANNFTLDESLGNIDNNHLKLAVSEVEGMLTSFMGTVEGSRASSVQQFRNYETELLNAQ